MFPEPRRPVIRKNPVSRGKDMDTIMAMHHEEEAEAVKFTSDSAAEKEGEKAEEKKEDGEAPAPAPVPAPAVAAAGGEGETGGEEVGEKKEESEAAKEETEEEEEKAVPKGLSERPPPVTQTIKGRRKGRRLTALDDSDESEQDDSESYKASE